MLFITDQTRVIAKDLKKKQEGGYLDTFCRRGGEGDYLDTFCKRGGSSASPPPPSPLACL